VDVAHPFQFNLINNLMNNTKKIIFISLLTITTLSNAQYISFVKGETPQKSNTINKQIYPFLHNWNDINTQQLLNKIEKIASDNQTNTPYNINNPESFSIKSWHNRQILYYSSVCLEKALYTNPQEPSGPFSEDYMRRLYSIARFMNLKDEKFILLDDKMLNNYCSSTLTTDFSIGNCQTALDPTVRSSESILSSAVPFAINILKRDTTLPAKVPVSCAINKENPNLLLTYKTKAQYQITKPFELKEVNTFLGPRKLNVGEALVITPEIKDSKQNPLVWKSLIVQH
jgi:hypothetical protein